MRRKSILTRRRATPRHRGTRIVLVPHNPGYKPALGSNGTTGVTIPVTFPMLVTGAFTVAVGMTFWHIMTEASKVYKKPRF